MWLLPDILLRRYVEGTEALGRAAFRWLSPSVWGEELAGATEDQYVASTRLSPWTGDLFNRIGSRKLAGGLEQVQFVLVAPEGRADQVIAVYLDRDGHVTRPPWTPNVPTGLRPP